MLLRHVPTSERERATLSPDLSSVFTLLENGTVRCLVRTAEGSPCRSRGFSGESVQMHFSHCHPASRHRLVCVLCEKYVGVSELKRHLSSFHADLFTAAVMSAAPYDPTGWRTVYSARVRALLEEENDVFAFAYHNIEDELGKLWNAPTQRVPAGYATWLACARGQEEKEQSQDGERTRFELLGNGKVRCRSRLVDGGVCAGLGFAPEQVKDHFEHCHPRSVFRVNCVLCKKDVSPSILKAHLIRYHPLQFPSGVGDWLSVYSSHVRVELEQRGDLHENIEREMGLLRVFERVPSSFQEWLLQAERVRGRVDETDLDVAFERCADGRFKCRMERPLLGVQCNTAPFAKGSIGTHFAAYHLLSVHRTKCVICGQSLSQANGLPRHLRRCHSDLFASEESQWRSVYEKAVRSALERDGVEESEIESELMMLYEHEKVPAQFHKWAMQ